MRPYLQSLNHAHNPAGLRGAGGPGYTTPAGFPAFTFCLVAALSRAYNLPSPNYATMELYK